MRTYFICANASFTIDDCDDDVANEVRFNTNESSASETQHQLRCDACKKLLKNDGGATAEQNTTNERIIPSSSVCVVL